MKKLACIILAALMTVSFFGCKKDPAGGESSTSDATSSAASGSSETGELPSELVSDPTASTDSTGSLTSGAASTGGSTINSTTSTAPPSDLDQDWSSDKHVVQDLGDTTLEPFPVDVNYDWGQCVLKMGDTYKKWWTRGSPHDGIWYAESKDLKNWTNVQMVARVDEDKKYMKMHLADPGVVYVNGKYYIYIETEVMGVDAGDNVILLATSTDGKNLTFYPNNENPQPVMQPDADSLGKGYYGVGMPCVIYKDGKFLMYYFNGVAKEYTKLATSSDGIHFTPNSSNPIVFDRSGVGVAYNDLTKKFMMIYGANPNDYDKKAGSISNIYVQESDDGINWPYKTTADGSKSPIVVNNSNNQKIRAFPGFVTNEHGHINTPTFYTIYTEGKLAAPGEWWMTHWDTFVAHISAVNLKKYGKRPIDLPNGKKISTANLAAYKDKVVEWKPMSTTAKRGTPTIDGKMDDIYKNTPELSVSRLVSVNGTLPSDTTATVRVLWDENACYLYAHVKDKKVSYSYKIPNLAEMYHRDSIAFFFDVPNDHDGTETGYSPLQYCFSVCANGDMVAINPTGNINISSEFTMKSKVQRVSDGYTVEASITWNDLIKSMIKEGKTIGFDAAINDDMGRGDRDASICWSDYTGNQYRYYSRLGDLKLVK